MAYDYGGLQPVSHNTSLYPFVKDAYVGELPGYIYNPYKNRYEADPKAQQQFYEQQGLAPKQPKDPNLLSDVVLPIAATSLAVEGVKAGIGAANTAWGPKTAAEQLAAQQLAQQGTNTALTGATATQGAAPVASTATSAASQGTGLLGGAPAGGAPATPNLVSATSVPSSAGSGAANAGLGSTANVLGLAGMAYTYGNAAYQHGKPIITGNATEDDKIKAAMMTNMITAWIPPALDAVGIQFGHGKNYYRGKFREKALEQLAGGEDTLTFDKGDGSTWSLSKDDFRHNKDSFAYDQSLATMTGDIGAANALSYLLTRKEPGSKEHEQIASMLAKAHGDGVSTQALYGKYSLDYNTARSEIEGAKDLDRKQKDILINGLDEAWGVNAYANGANPAPAPAPAPQAPAPPPAQPTGLLGGTGTGAQVGQPRDPGMGNGVAQPNVPRPGLPQQLAPRGPVGLLGGAPQALAPRGPQNIQQVNQAQLQRPVPSGPTRVSPGVWKDAKGTYLSKDGKR